MTRWLALALFAVGVTSCTFVSEDWPLVDAKDAAFPFAALTYVEQGTASLDGKSTTVFRKSDGYFLTDGTSVHGPILLAPVGDGFFVAQHSEGFGNSGYGFIYLKLDIAGKKIDLFEKLGADENVIAPGLRDCAPESSVTTICVDDLAAYIRVAQEAISAGAQPDSSAKIESIRTSGGTLTEGLAAYHEGDYWTAITILRPLAAADDVDAQVALAVMYYIGSGTPQDYDTAAKLFRRAAVKGNAQAQNNIGEMYEHGLGVPQSYAEAAWWYATSAAQGHPLAKQNLKDIEPKIAEEAVVGDWANCNQVERPEISILACTRIIDAGKSDRIDLAYYNRGRAFQRRGDHTPAAADFEAARAETALRQIRLLAEQGDARAQVNLGVKYENGEGVAQDEAEAVAWFRSAADQGNAEAQYRLGLMHASGRGVQKDLSVAAEWYRRSAEQGNADAQFGLGLWYVVGRGVPQDYREAAQWYRRAAALDHPKAQYGLGLLYEDGRGLPLDYAEAANWYRKAASNGHALATSRLRIVEERLTQIAQTAEKQRLAEGEAAYARGDYSAALTIWTPLAEDGVADAQFYLGVMYDNGEGVAEDNAEAARWYRLAAEQGVVPAQVNLGLGYASGEEVRQDYTEAVKWFRLAADAGDARAQVSLGVMYDNGEGVAEDDAEAARWYRLAAEQGVVDAQFNLGVMYANGNGVPQDYREAAKWFRLAAAQGDQEALQHLRLVEEEIVRRTTPAITPTEPTGAGAGVIIQTETIAIDQDEVTLISIEGNLQLGDELRFANVAIGSTEAIVMLNSPGGNLIAGMEIGKTIRIKGFATLVPEGFSCTSACAFAWLGGQPRFMGEGSTIGFHAAFAIENGQAVVNSVGNAIVGAYLTQLGLPLEAVVFITQPRPDEIRWLTFEDAEAIGLDVRPFEATAVGEPEIPRQTSGMMINSERTLQTPPVGTFVKRTFLWSGEPISDQSPK